MMGARAGDLRTLHDKLATKSMTTYDFKGSDAHQLWEVVGTSETCDYDFDLKEAWVSRDRFNKLVRQYIDPVSYDRWLELVDKQWKGRKSLSFLRTNDIPGRPGMRQWGSCLLGFGFRGWRNNRQGIKPTITLHSRTCYLGYIGMLDLALVHTMARDIADRVGCTTSDISFSWHVQATQLHFFRSLAWFFQDEERAELLLAQKSVRGDPFFPFEHQFRRVVLRPDEEGQLYGDATFASALRLRRRYHTEVLGYEHGAQYEGGERSSHTKRFQPLPSVPVSELSMYDIRSRIEQHGENGVGEVIEFPEA